MKHIKQGGQMMQKGARMGWISVKDKMPDKYVQIIIYDKVMGVTFGYYGDFKGEKMVYR
jgi:hypothetical protein